MAVFQHAVFLVVDNPANADYTRAELEAVITRNGGKCVFRLPQETRGAIAEHHITHVVTSTYEFAECAAAQALMLPVTAPQWLFDSELAGPRNYRLYSPVPLPFMDRVVLCIADNLPQGDRELMYAGTRAFGGQYLDALSRYTTHLVAVDLSNNKAVVAANIRAKERLEIKIVLPHWVDACMVQQRRVDETPYLLLDPVVLQTGKPNFLKHHGLPFADDYAASIGAHAKSLALQDKAVYVAPDYSLSEHLKQAVHDVVALCGGTVVDEFDPSHTHVYIGKYRHGDDFLRACASPHTDVASLHWLYHLVMIKRYVAPLQSNLLHFPLPDSFIPEFINLRISVTGYTGDARHYLATLIASMGAEFTRTLDSENDFLVCGRPTGDKYDAVKNKWLSVKVVNHLWIEECFAQWKFLPHTDTRYSTLDQPVQLLGKARLHQRDLARWVLAGSEHSGIDDSADEEEIRQPEAKSESTSPQESGSVTKSPRLDSPNDDVHEQIVVEDTSQAVSSPAGRAVRSARQKAERKLHSNMEDLNAYTSMAKSVKKMSAYMEELEKTVTTPKKKREATPEKVEPAPLAKKKKAAEATHITAIMTGCESELVLNRADVVKLAKLGITIVNDYNPKKHIDTIVAPRVLRTEKFLKSLSKAKQIVHPRYLSEVLKRLAVSDATWEEINKEYALSDYSLDKVIPLKQINEDLGVKGKASGLVQLLQHRSQPIFSNVNVNLSSNINGGPELIASILKEHGLSGVKTIKLSGSVSKSSMLANDSGSVILVAHKTKDAKAVAALADVTVVDWNWCVRSIFSGKVEDFEPYRITK